MVKQTKCAICGEDVDTSACGQFIARITTEDDTQHETTGKTHVKRMILCESHSFALQSWIAEQRLKHLGLTV